MFTNDRYLKLAGVLLLLTGVCAAKSPVARIEVVQGGASLVRIEGAPAREFTIWSGPGTSSGPEGATGLAVGEADIAAWQAGAVPPPTGGPVFNVIFLCEACEPARKDHWRCYGVRYAPGAEGGPGLIQIPAPGDQEFPTNVQTIYRGVEGQWFRASERWEQVVRARLREALAAAR